MRKRNPPEPPSRRAQKRALLKKGSNQIVKAQVKLERQWRAKNVGRRLTEKVRKELYKKIRTDAYSIAYRMNPEVWRNGR